MFDYIQSNKYENLFNSYNQLNIESEFQLNIDNISEELTEANVLIIGAAGTIGQNVLNYLLQFKFKSITLLDTNENELVRILRRIRAKQFNLTLNVNIVSLSITDPLFNLWLESQVKFDLVFNFAAAKHVRAERNNWSVASLLNVNALALKPIVNYAERNQSKLFSVSTDKAANPSNLMGASKRLMELIMLGSYQGCKSARFANVAFSNGSLLESWELKIHESLVLSVPKDCKRFLISPAEAAKICMLSTFDSKSSNSLYIPNSNLINSILLSDALEMFLDFNGLLPEFFNDQNEALEFMSKRKYGEPWPVVITELDTFGEKLEEEFITSSEKYCDDQKYINLKCIETKTLEKSELEVLLDDLSRSIKNPSIYSVTFYREILFKIAPLLQDSSKLHDLDSRI
jgi:FlaA1/EpsC-like NDP-sugar epimerase